MKSGWLLTLACAWPLASAGAQLAAPSVSFPDPAIGRIDLLDAGGRVEGHGTGFWISATEVVTNWHVIRHSRTATITMPDGAAHRLTHLLGADECADAVLLRADPPFDGRVFPLAMRPAREGQPVRIVGYSSLTEHPALEGTVQCQRDLGFRGPTLILHMERGIGHGFSGSPIVDARGCVLGVVDLGLPAKAFGGPAEAIRSFRSDTPTPLELWDREPRTPCGRALDVLSDVPEMGPEQGDEAIRRLRAITDESPDCWAAWGSLTGRYGARGDANAALDAATRAAAFSPVAEHGFTLARLLRARGRGEEADAAIARAKEVDPSGFTYIRTFEQALDLMNQGRFQDALPGFTVAVNGDPESLEVRADYLQCLAQTGHASEALPQCDWFVQRFPSSALAHFTRGVALAYLMRLPEALREYKAAADLDPREPGMRQSLGQTYARLGQFAEAEQQLAILRDMAPARAAALEAVIARTRAEQKR